MRRFLCHERLYVRFLALFGLGVVLFTLAWTLSYYLMPEGVLRGRTGSAMLAGDEAAGSFIAEWLRIVALNLVAGSLIVLANRIYRFRGYPLGYIIPLAWLTTYAICLGTNSFSIQLPERMAPSLAVFGRTGLYEIAAFTLVAAATYSINLYNVTQFIPPTYQPVTPKPRFSLTLEQWVGLSLAIAVLLAANAREAYMIMTL
jgi:hypothetical protein